MSTPNTAPTSGTLTLETVVKILKNRTRWKVLRLLAPGEALPVSVIAKRVGLRPQTMSKHMIILHNHGIVVTGYGHLYTLAPAFRPAPGTLTIDLGHCLIRPASEPAA